MWRVEYTDEWGEWFSTLSDKQQKAIAERVKLLEVEGPSLGRPAVGGIKDSAFDPQMKELVVGPSIRTLFMFDPRRVAILLLGGDKEGTWNEWYRKAVPMADALDVEHLRQLELEGLLPP